MVTKAEGKKTVEIIKTEVENYLIDLLRKNKRLQKKINDSGIDDWKAV